MSAYIGDALLASLAVWLLWSVIAKPVWHWLHGVPPGTFAAEVGYHHPESLREQRRQVERPRGQIESRER